MAKGDQIYVYRPLGNLEGVYKHHGIDCGDETVIHYRKPSEIIERTPIEVFSRGNPISVVQYPEGFCFLPDIVVNRAYSRLGENKYNFLFNNCEHFATWCKTGISDSKQIREFLPAISKINLENLPQPLQNALGATDSQNSERLVTEALNDIKSLWETIQPQYKQAVKESEIWHKVATEAVRRNRDDLARAALLKKQKFTQKAQELASELDQLARMTEKLLNDVNVIV